MMISKILDLYINNTFHKFVYFFYLTINVVQMSMKSFIECLRFLDEVYTFILELITKYYFINC